MTNLKISTFEMMVGPEYKTPWCGWATRKDGAGVIQGINCEGKTQKEALRKIKAIMNNEKRT